MITETNPKHIYMPTDSEMMFTNVPNIGRWSKSLCETCAGRERFKWYGADGLSTEWTCNCKSQLVLFRWLWVRGFSKDDMRIRRADMTGVSNSADQWLNAYAGTTDQLRRSIESGTSAVLRGEHGSGKTSLATLVAKRAAAIGFSPMKTSMDKMVGALQGWGERQDWFGAHFRTADLLVIDDFGNRVSPATDKLMPTIEAIVLDRDSNYRPTIFTTNMNESSLKDGYGYVLNSVLKSGHGMRDISLSEDWRGQANTRKQAEQAAGLTRPLTLG